MNDRPASESLADYVRRVRNEKGLSQSDVERESGRRGNKIAGTYVSRIENEIATNPSTDKLVALARGLGVSEEEVFAKARGRSLNDRTASEDFMLGLFRSLPAAQQSDLLGILQYLHGKYGEKARGSDVVKRKQQRAA